MQVSLRSFRKYFEYVEIFLKLATFSYDEHLSGNRSWRAEAIFLTTSESFRYALCQLFSRTEQDGTKIHTCCCGMSLPNQRSLADKKRIQSHYVQQEILMLSHCWYRHVVWEYRSRCFVGQVRPRDRVELHCINPPGPANPRPTPSAEKPRVGPPGFVLTTKCPRYMNWWVL
jgi:hypothetical protein